MANPTKYNPYSMIFGVPLGNFELRVRYKIEVDLIRPEDPSKGVTVLLTPDMDVPHGFFFPEIQLNYKNWVTFEGIKSYGRNQDVVIPLNDEEIEDVVKGWNLEYRLPEIKEALIND